MNPGRCHQCEPRRPHDRRAARGVAGHAGRHPGPRGGVEGRNTVVVWKLRRCLPIKYVGSPLSAGESDAAIEEIELAVEGLDMEQVASELLVEQREGAVELHLQRGVANRGAAPSCAANRNRSHVVIALTLEPAAPAGLLVDSTPSIQRCPVAPPRANHQRPLRPNRKARAKRGPLPRRGQVR